MEDGRRRLQGNSIAVKTAVQFGLYKFCESPRSKIGEHNIISCENNINNNYNVSDSDIMSEKIMFRLCEEHGWRILRNDCTNEIITTTSTTTTTESVIESL
eukprot:UN28848